MPEEPTTSQTEFMEAPKEIQDLLVAVMTEERKVAHLDTRPMIHQKILDHVKSCIS